MIAHGACPGLNEAGMGGPCAERRHLLGPPHLASGALVRPRHEPKAAFTDGRVVTTARTCRQKRALRQPGSPSSEKSSVGHFSDPDDFSENESWFESDSDPCNPMCSRPCQKHGIGYSSSDDSDDALTAKSEQDAEEIQLKRATDLIADTPRKNLKLIPG